MKKIIVFILVGTLFTCGISGCGIKDKPMPLSQNNLDLLSKEISISVRSLAPSPAQDGEEMLASLIKNAVEKKLKYNFDKTFRYMLLFPQGSSPQIIGPAINYVANNTQKALDSGLISRRTYDLFEANKGSTPLTKENEEFLKYVTECQQKNNNICDSKSLLSILASHNVIKYDAATTDNNSLIFITAPLENKYDIAHMGINKWITAPDGKDIVTNGLLEAAPEKKFIVNVDKLQKGKKLSQMIEEEKVTLSK